MKTVAIIGGTDQALRLMTAFSTHDNISIQWLIVSDSADPAISYAENQGIKISHNWERVIADSIDLIVFTVPNHPKFMSIAQNKGNGSVIIPYQVVEQMTKLVDEKEALIQQLKDQTYQQTMILTLTQDAMIAIDVNEQVTVFNPSAERMTGLSHQDVMGRAIQEVMPTSKLPRVLASGQSEVNQGQDLDNGTKIITTRQPIRAHDGFIYGAFAVFKDITEVEQLAEEVTNLKSIQTMLNAVIQSSEEAISVVDEHGKGIMINPAYTRMTGLTEEDVIGKPATADISEGASMHMKVLQTRKPVRGVRMKVGQARKDVIVNVAPIIVNGKLKGSVGIIHDMSEITNMTKELNRARQIIRTLEAKYSFDDIKGHSEEIELVIEQAKLAATTPVTILLRGESGTGKELFAHAIHNASKRKYNKFVRVNGAAISEHLLESELFGYEEGAFTGAKKSGRRGYFEEADGGSLFLDEIGELSLQMQAKLLRVLQEKEIVRVGGTKPIPVNVRVITATNVNLEKRIADGAFREDLYYRLNRMPIFIPPLRQRKEDLAPLSHHLLNKINQDFGRNVERISEAALDQLKVYHWPGNVRELENVLGRIVIHMGFHENEIIAGHIPTLKHESLEDTTQPITIDSNGKSLNATMETYEKQVIQQALAENNDNKTKTAQQLGISVRALYYKLNKHNLEESSTQ
ncbi:sigma-54 interaction domain-containing protein [Tuberibacillus sp. Marseille-P3662]|uniref:sigma-54 interaction domain-containing protein n=1 Tax=Tuberibacillus sp. Marseille-P3662 TaxID=1965358 RepID=UPI000A1C94A1|nr:sigma-54-dependent Fis family transcriptional regulator [Tuberibacillus sp. Marseille-P3662]